MSPAVRLAPAKAVPRLRRNALGGLVAAGAAAAIGLLWPGCGAPPPATGSEPTPQVIAHGTPMSDACYAGSTAQVEYGAAISWNRVEAFWRRNGWRVTRMPYRGTLTGIPFDYDMWGSADDAGDPPRILLFARQPAATKTSLGALVARSTGDVRQHSRQAAEAVAIVDRLRRQVEQELGLAPSPIHVGWNGCR